MTISPYAAHDREVPEVAHSATGETLNLDEFLGDDYAEIEKKRLALREDIARDEAKWVCAYCREPVHLVCLQRLRRFHFRHQNGGQECLHARKGLSEEQINAIKYNGAKESQAHVRMKEIVAESLRRDPRFSDVKTEAVWKGQDRKTWRKPDVSAFYQGLKVAIEIQLSTTFLRVIAERRVFYLQEGGLLLWIFKSYDEDRARLTQEDLFYNNNRNLFLASEETLRASKEEGRFALECRWVEPKASPVGIDTVWRGQTAFFDELTLDMPNQRAFLFDYDRAEGLERKKLVGMGLRVRFERFWLALGNGAYDALEWESLRSEFRAHRLMLPQWHSSAQGPWRRLDILYSAKTGRPVNLGHSDLLKVAHYVEDKHKGFLWLFHKALIAYGHDDHLAAMDPKGNWVRKSSAFRDGKRDADPAYAPVIKFNALAEFLFPEIAISSV